MWFGRNSPLMVHEVVGWGAVAVSKCRGWVQAHSGVGGKDSLSRVEPGAVELLLMKGNTAILGCLVICVVPV